jgi:peptide/nickel transport system substrate-binding protein
VRGSAGPTSRTIEKLRDLFAREVDTAKKKALAEQIQQKAFEYGTHVPLGETSIRRRCAKGIKGLVTGPGNFYWNIQK